jgi:GntR family transcriptional regulator, transcriptional repressor for pyruvate dehydrogenase complex
MDDLGTTAWKHLAAPAPTPAGERLERDSLADRVREAVLGMIDHDGLTTGDALPSTGTLAERFGVSRTVIREALSALAALGIVEVSNGRSAAVRAPDPGLVRFYLAHAIRESRDDSFTTLMDLRGPLEVRAALRAAARFADGADEPIGGRERLETLRGELTAALPDSALYPRLDLRLHQEIALLSGNRALQGLLEAVSIPLFRAMQDVRAARDLHGTVGAEHADHLRIIEAILAGDPETAAAAMEQHMRAVESFEIVP